MGMFDHIICEAPLPKTSAGPPSSVFQTKDTPDQYMTSYTITADGRLVWTPYKMDVVPKCERPHPDEGILGLIASMRRVVKAPEAVLRHGDIYFYEYDQHSGGECEYMARFTDGVLTKIDLVEYVEPRLSQPNKKEQNR